jgi:GGDEF domain-containing protein
MSLAERIRSEIEKEIYCRAPGEIQPEPLHLSGICCSIGVATLARHVPALHDLATAKSLLLRLADAAMYRAKEAGRNRVMLADETADMNPTVPRTAAR